MNKYAAAAVITFILAVTADSMFDRYVRGQVEIARAEKCAVPK